MTAVRDRGSGAPTAAGVRPRRGRLTPAAASTTAIARSAAATATSASSAALAEGNRVRNAAMANWRVSGLQRIGDDAADRMVHGRGVSAGGHGMRLRGSMTPAAVYRCCGMDAGMVDVEATRSISQMRGTLAVVT
jgi:hypothetical protein